MIFTALSFLRLILGLSLSEQVMSDRLYAQYLRHNKYSTKKQCAKLILTLPLVSGNVELNPGPSNIKYTCGGECARAVKFGPSIAYHQCNIWYHQECAGMNSVIFECTNTTIEMQWTYIKWATSLFDSSMSSINSSLNLDRDIWGQGWPCT